VTACYILTQSLKTLPLRHFLPEEGSEFSQRVGYFHVAAVFYPGKYNADGYLFSGS
jgi:hypothetical protein